MKEQMNKKNKNHNDNRLTRMRIKELLEELELDESENTQTIFFKLNLDDDSSYSSLSLSNK